MSDALNDPTGGSVLDVTIPTPARTSDPLDPTLAAAIRTMAAGLTLIVCSLILAIVGSVAGRPDPGTLLIAPPVTEVGP